MAVLILVAGLGIWAVWSRAPWQAVAHAAPDPCTAALAPAVHALSPSARAGSAKDLDGDRSCEWRTNDAVVTGNVVVTYQLSHAEFVTSAYRAAQDAVELRGGLNHPAAAGVYVQRTNVGDGGYFTRNSQEPSSAWEAGASQGNVVVIVTYWPAETAKPTETAQDALIAVVRTAVSALHL
jgi:hypothetical protein